VDKLLQFINGLNIGTIINIGLIILILSGSWFIASKLGIIKAQDAKIEQLEIDKKEQNELIATKNKLIVKKDKESRKVKKELDEKNKELDDIKKGIDMDDAIKLYNSK